MSFQYPPKGPTPGPDSSPPTGSPPPTRSLRPVQLPAHPPRVTYALMAVTASVYLLQTFGPQVMGVSLVTAWGLKSNAAIMAGEWWRLFTPMLLHGSIFHIGFNMYALYVLGPSLERFYGGWRFLLLYVVAGFAGNTLSFILSPYNSLGASTAIFGLLGAQGVFLYLHRDLFGDAARRSLANIVFIAAVNLVIGLSPGIDNWGHMGGLIGGTLFAWFGGPRLGVRDLGLMLELKNERPALISLLTAVTIMLLFLGAAMALGGAG
ncbi:MAG TPA: rhomboid family intramembrane serine protease [Anaerolineae bacterium]|nr:rhomboid family intramembrane serine protease [Anaerolineae bacterium]